jgi:hypothetical protein
MKPGAKDYADDGGHKYGITLIDGKRKQSSNLANTGAISVTESRCQAEVLQFCKNFLFPTRICKYLCTSSPPFPTPLCNPSPKHTLTHLSTPLIYTSS